MKGLEEIKEMLCYELDEFAKKGELSAGGLEAIQKLTDSIKNIEKIKMFEELEEGSYAGGSYEGGSRRNSQRGGQSNRGGSYARTYVRGYYRDSGIDDDWSMARGGGRGNSRRGGSYSREEGKEAIMEKLEEAMEEAETKKEREALERCMKQVENA